MMWSRKTQNASMNFISSHYFTQAFYSHDISEAFAGGIL